MRAAGVMNVLVTGSGASGSWQIRGEQLGRAIGATVLAKAIDMEPFDAVVVVKRPPPDLVARVHRAGVPLIWDIVDAWPQPAGNDWCKAACMTWLRDQIAAIRPAAVVAATQAMAADLAEFGLPVLALPHHARPGLRRNPSRPLAVIGYEGSEGYIRGWRASIEDQCRRRGLRFVVNPDNLTELDVVLALRDATGYAPRHWKSNVKLANAQASGTPVIACREAGYLETASGAELWADSPIELSQALDVLADPGERRERSKQLTEAAPRLPDLARVYADWMRSIRA
jgi:hypothetical protein